MQNNPFYQRKSLDFLGYPNYELDTDGFLYNDRMSADRCIWDKYKITLRYKYERSWTVTGPVLMNLVFYRPELQFHPGHYMSCMSFGCSNYICTMYGHIYSLNKHVYMQPKIDHKGYHSVRMRHDDGIDHTVKIHRAVALLFIPNPDNKPEVNHLDGNKANNFASNLEWTTSWENMQHSKRLKQHSHFIITDEMAHEICRRLQRGDSRHDVAMALDIAVHNVDSIRYRSTFVPISEMYNIPLPPVRGPYSKH